MSTHTFRRIVATGLALAALVPCVGSAQTAVPDKKPLAADQAGSAPATLQLMTMPAPRQIQFLAEFSPDKKTGTASVGWKTGQQIFQLRFSGPVSEGSAEPVSLTGLPAGGSAGIDWNYLRKTGPTPLEQEEIERRCKALSAEKLADGCSDTDFPEGRERDAFNYLQHLYNPAGLFGVTGEVAQTVFSFVTPSNPTTTKERHPGGSATIRAGIIAPAFASAVVSYTFLNAYRAAGSPSNVCVPIGEAGRLKCDPAIVGEPKKVTRSVVTLEVRKFFSAITAVSPSIQYDFNEKVTAIAFPFYFLSGPAGTTGGVRLDWRSDTREVTALVFIGGAINAIPR